MHLVDTPHHVVVWDPEEEYWEGALVDFAASKRLQARGVVTLPTHPDHFRASGIGGYSRRGWGAGVPLDSMTPAFVAPIALYVHPQVRGLAWAARLVPDRRPGRMAVERREGRIRFAPDSGQRFPIAAAYTEDVANMQVVPDMQRFGEPDEYGGWTITGRGHTNVAAEGHYGFSLYGSVPGFCVAWLAATTCPVRIS